MENQPRIAIIGAGLGGLMLACILHRHGVVTSVFEREPFSLVRSQGWSLDMHADAGQLAIERAGLSDAFRRIARYDDQEARVYDNQGNLRFINTDVSNADRPEVDRGQLRQMLLDALPAPTVSWGHKLSAVTLLADGSFALEFGSQNYECDLVVGADGAWSRVRPFLSDARPVYSGVTFVELGFDDADNQYPEIARLVGRGLMFALGERKALIGHRDANAHVGAYAGLRVPEDWSRVSGIDWQSPAAAGPALVAPFDGWDDSLLQLIRHCETPFVPRPLYALPVGHRWQSRPGVTLLGDAAHLMSPFTGEGANLALRDAADLAATLLEMGWQQAIPHYESTLFARAEPAALAAKEALDQSFSDDGLSFLLQQMQEHQG